ncbi:protein of unknown function [Streptomyces sp. KY75]|nr:protein of unknown function [Streptomyces sp. KY75]
MYVPSDLVRCGHGPVRGGHCSGGLLNSPCARTRLTGAADGPGSSRGQWFMEDEGTRGVRGTSADRVPGPAVPPPPSGPPRQPWPGQPAPGRPPAGEPGARALRRGAACDPEGALGRAALRVDLPAASARAAPARPASPPPPSSSPPPGPRLWTPGSVRPPPAGPRRLAVRVHTASGRAG